MVMYPYYQGSVPRAGQNIAWAESSAVSFSQFRARGKNQQDSGGAGGVRGADW